MATYSAVSASEKDADSPINVGLIDKLDQNPHAIAEGASGAPRIQTAAINDGAVTSAKLASGAALANIGPGGVNQTYIGSGAVHQAQLSTSTGAVGTSSGNANNFTLPGGSYGFYPQISADSSSDDATSIQISGFNSGLTTTYVTNIYLNPASSSMDLNAQQRYVNSSPPFNLGDGEIPIFVFLLLDSGGSVKGYYEADVPPWAYNGPTVITPDRVYLDKAGHLVKVKRVAEAVNREAGEVQWREVEIDDAIKNADMNLIPHPFPDKLPTDKVVLLDPVSTESIFDLHCAGEVVGRLIKSDYLRFDNVPLARSTPRGVMAVNFTWRNSGRI